MRSLGRSGLILLLTVTLVTPPGIARADYDSVCGGNSSAGAIAGQRQEYCNAAKAADKAADAGGKAANVWTAVATICVSMCGLVLADVFGGWASHVCSGANITGSLIEATMTKQFAESLATLPVDGMGLAMSISSGNEAGAAAVAAGGKQVAEGTANVVGGSISGNAGSVAAGGKMIADGQSKIAANTASDGATKAGTMQKVTACVSAAMATGKAVMKKQSAASSKDEAKKNLALAAQLNSQAAAAAGSTLPGGEATKQTGFGGMANSGLGAGATATEIARESASSGNPCGGTGLEAITACAVANDSNLPPAVNTPGFRDAFEQVTGQKLGDFLAQQGKSPAEMMTNALASKMDPEQAQKLAALSADFQRKIMNAEGVEGTAYAHGGGGSAGSKGAGTEIADMMKGFMDQMNPGQGEEGPKSAKANELAFGVRVNRSLASPEDPRGSIFDRVTHRYGICSTRLMAPL